MSNCFIKVKHKVNWTIEPNILIKEWFANTTKKYVILFVAKKRSIREDGDSVKCVGSEMILERLYI